MKANPKLISALRRAADRIEKDPSYDWFTSSRCNCGILAQELLEVSATELDSWMRKGGCPIGTWKEAAEIVCQVTLLPLNGIIKTLTEYGLEVSDFRKIEDIGRCPEERHIPKTVIVPRWMREQADSLERQLVEASSTKSKDVQPQRVF